MKKLLILSSVILIAGVSFVGCKKKPTKTNCYVCQRYELIYSPIYTQYNQPRKLVALDTLCGRTDQWIALYMEQHKTLDTIDTPNDILLLNQRSSICEIQ